MNAGAVLLEAVLADPADDLAKLAYADWCEEEGDTARADYIRLEMGRARRQPGVDPDVLCLRQYDRLVASVPFKDARYFTRVSAGFVVGVSCTAAEWEAHGRAVCALHPVRFVRLTDCTSAPHLTADKPAWLLAARPTQPPSLTFAQWASGACLAWARGRA